MKVDKAAFLLLTGTIAGIACGTTPPVQPQSSITPPPSTTVPTPPPTPSTVATLPPPPPPPSTVATLPPPPPPPPPPPDPKNQKPLGEDNSGCGMSKAVYDPAKTSCDDSTAAPVNCDGVPMFPANEYCRGNLGRLRCNVYSNAFKPKVMADAYQCLKTKVGGRCDNCTPFKCGHEALMNACPDPTVSSDCDTIARSCSGMNRVRCSSYLSGMTPAARRYMVECLTKSCSKGFARCLEAMPVL